MDNKSLNNYNETILDKIAHTIIINIGSPASLIIHTLFFIACFLLPVLNIMDFEKMMLALTTIVSLEAIYLSIFIQISVNRNQEHIKIIKEDVTDIQEDIDEIQEDIDEIQEDIEEISEEVIDDEEEKSAQENVAATNTKTIELSVLQEKIADLERYIDDLKKML